MGMTREEVLEANLADGAELIEEVSRSGMYEALQDRMTLFLGREEVKLVREIVTQREGGRLSEQAMDEWYREAEQLLGASQKMSLLARRVKLLVEQLRDDRENAQHAAWDREEARERSNDG